jgi:hypothetical protein
MKTKISWKLFKEVCLNEFIEYFDEISSNEDKDQMKEYKKEIKKCFHKAKSYDDIREIYGEFGLTEYDILSNFSK